MSIHWGGKGFGHVSRRPKASGGGTPTPTPTPTELLNTFTERGITWNFSAAVPVGQYVTGDSFAVGGVVTSTSPISEAVDGTYAGGETYTDRIVHGLMVDPGRDGGTGANPATTPQGWDSLPKAPSVPSVTELAYDAAKNLDPAITAASISGPASLIKGLSLLVSPPTDSRTKLSNASLLTLVASVPPVGSFRRWAGATNKAPIFFASDVDWSVLPTITMPVGATLPTAASLIAKLGPLQTYMNQMLYTRGINPTGVQSQYGGDIANDAQQAMLFTMTDGVSDADRKAVGHALIQGGLDVAGALDAGRRWSSATFSFGGAHQWLKALIIYAARLLHNAANVTERNKLTAWVDGTNRKVFGDDMMVVPINRFRIEATPFESSTSRIWPEGLPDWSENSIDWLSKPSSTDSVGLSLDIAYRQINGYPFLTTALITRLLGMESAWNNPQFFEYADTFFNKWVRRSKPTNAYFYDFNRRNVDAYYAVYSPAYIGSGAPTLVRRAARGRYAWIEASENFNLTNQPAATDLVVTVDGSAVTLTSVSTTASGTASSGTTNITQPVITVASATGIRIGQRVECASLPADTFVTSVSGTTIGINSLVPATFAAGTAITFHNVFVYDRSLVAVLPTPLTSAAQPVAIGYTAPGSGFIRNLRGTGIGTLSASAATNHTGELPTPATSKDVIFNGGGSLQQWSGSTALASESIRRLCMSMRFWIDSKTLNATILSSFNGSTGTFRLYNSSTTDFRMNLQNQQWRLPGDLGALPTDAVITAHLIIDLTATTYATIYRGVFRWNGAATPGFPSGERVASTTGSTGTLDGLTALNIATIFTNGVFIGSQTSGGQAFWDGGWSETLIRWGGDALALPADFSGSQFAWNADWGGNGENVWGAAPQLYWAGPLSEWNGGVPNRGNGGAKSQTPRRVTDEGELITAYTVAAI